VGKDWNKDWARTGRGLEQGLDSESVSSTGTQVAGSGLAEELPSTASLYAGTARLDEPKRGFTGVHTVMLRVLGRGTIRSGMQVSVSVYES
jgi:hypothetical protein